MLRIQDKEESPLRLGEISFPDISGKLPNPNLVSMISPWFPSHFFETTSFKAWRESKKLTGSFVNVLNLSLIGGNICRTSTKVTIYVLLESSKNCFSYVSPYFFKGQWDCQHVCPAELCKFITNKNWVFLEVWDRPL